MGSGDLRPYKPSESHRYSVGGSILPWSMAAGKKQEDFRHGWYPGMLGHRSGGDL